MSLLVEPETTRADIEEAILNHVATLHRMPEHWTDRRAGIHQRIDDLLTQWQAAP